MTESLTQVGYEQTKAKLADLEQRLVRLLDRNDLGRQHQVEAQRSCQQMIAQYRREVKLFEAMHPEMASRP
jgi:hypothetical protein